VPVVELRPLMVTAPVAVPVGGPAAGAPAFALTAGFVTHRDRWVRAARDS
jgi:hypothetical protein